MKKILALLIMALLLLSTGFASNAAKPETPENHESRDILSYPFTNNNNSESYEDGHSNYSISFNYVKGKGYNASAAFEPSPEMSAEEIEALYINTQYPDATLWLWDYVKGLWIPIPLELSLQQDDLGNPVTVEFAANWKANTKVERVTKLDINTAIGEALISQKIASGNDTSACYLELAVGNWIEFNFLFPEASNRIQGIIPTPPFAAPPITKNSSYSNVTAYEAGSSQYSISLIYKNNKGYNASVAFEAPAGLSKEEIETVYINALYPDATLWLWDYGKHLWIPIPLELNNILETDGLPTLIEFSANWEDNQQIDHVTDIELNLAISDALTSNLNTNGNDWSDCWLELAVGHWVEFNVLYPIQ